MDYQYLNIVKNGFIAEIQLNRPQAANALSGVFLEEIAHAASSFRLANSSADREVAIKAYFDKRPADFTGE